MAAIAHLGTGLLGSAMVERHLALGDSVAVWNRTAAKALALEAKGGRAVPTIREALAGAERVHLTLTDDAAVDECLSQVFAALEPGARVFDHTTTSPDGTVARYVRADEASVDFTHAPVFMTPKMAREAAGMILLSGPRERCEAVRPVLARLTGEVWYVGTRLDHAAAYKLFGNAMTLVITGGLADILAMGRGLDMEPHEAVAVFERLIPGVQARAARVVKGDFAASFELTMARKDLRLALEAAERSNLPLAVMPALAARFDAVIAAGHGGEDYGVIAREAIEWRPDK